MRQTVLVILISLFTISLNAQRFKASLQAGIAGTQVSGDELSGFNKAGLSGGIAVKTFFNNKLGAGFKILYLQKGSRKPSKLDQGDPSYYLLRLNYIEIPLQIHYSFGKKLFAEAGPSLGYLVKHTEEDENGALENRNKFSQFDLSIACTLAYPFTERWNLRLEVWQSILAIRKHNDNVSYRLNEGQYNSVVALGLQYIFNPGKN